MEALSSQNSQHLRTGPTAKGPSKTDVSERHSDFSQGQSPERDTYEETLRQAGDLDDVEEQTEGDRQQDELLGRYSPWPCSATALDLEALRDDLLIYSRRPEICYQFSALDSDTPFASSCCNGMVYFSRALLQALDACSIAFFAAHEMAHTELRHYASRQRRLSELRRAIPGPPGSVARQRMELAAVLAVRHQEEFEADSLAGRWLGSEQGFQALQQLQQACHRSAPKSLSRPTHPSFDERLKRMSGRLGPPDIIEYLWALMDHQ